MSNTDCLLQPDSNAVSVHLVKGEIMTTLRQVESALRAFHDDQNQSSVLAEMPEAMQQVHGVLRLLHINGAVELADALCHELQNLVAHPETSTDGRLGVMGEGLEMLGRYLDFYLLQDQGAPQLLLPVINRLRQMGQRPLLREGYFLQSCSLPAGLDGEAPDRHAPPAEVGGEPRFLHRMFQLGLQHLLAGDTSAQRLLLMTKAVARMQELAADTAAASHWTLAVDALRGLADRLPLSATRTRVLAALERSFVRPFELPPVATRWDLISLTLGGDDLPARRLAEQIGVNHLPDLAAAALHAELHGPDQSVIHQVVTLLHAEMDAIETHVDQLGRQEPIEGGVATLADQLSRLGQVLIMLNCTSAGRGILQQVEQVRNWPEQPALEQLGTLMQVLLHGENAITLLDQRFTPGLALLPLNNTQISLHQLDEARHVLMTEVRSTLDAASRALLSYLDTGDLLHLQNVPTMLVSVGGALEFIGVANGRDLMGSTAEVIRRHFDPALPEPSIDVVNAVADVLACVDYHIEGMMEKKPIGTLPLVLGQRSIDRLKAA